MFSGCTSLTTVENLPNALLEISATKKCLVIVHLCVQLKLVTKVILLPIIFIIEWKGVTISETPSEDYVFCYNGTNTTRGKSAIPSN